MGVLPFVLAYQVISPLVMGNAVDTKYVCIRVIGVFDLPYFTGHSLWLGTGCIP